MPTLPSTTRPALPGLLAHELRWVIVRLLAESDLRVGELAAVTGQGANLVSYHLGKLRGAGLVTVRRSSADARDNYYALDLAAVGRAISNLADELHPGLVTRPPDPARARAARPTARVLFVCSGNSSRSPMAAAWLWHLGGPRVTARSAGISPRTLHPLAVVAMAEQGIDIGDHHPTRIGAFSRRRFDRVITLCDRAREAMPELPHQDMRAHWSVPNPAEAHPADLDAFRAVARELETRVRYLLPTLDRSHRRTVLDH
jgi:protein-tyrosine-phosphatase/DNA-binding transcriptional ArsR family regulator